VERLLLLVGDLGVDEGRDPGVAGVELLLLLGGGGNGLCVCVCVWGGRRWGWKRKERKGRTSVRGGKKNPLLSSRRRDEVRDLSNEDCFSAARTPAPFFELETGR